MNKKLLSFVLLLIATQLFCQSKITGIVKSTNNDKVLYDASVTLVETGETVQTDRIGYFQFTDVAPGTYTVLVTQISYRDFEQEVEVGEENVDMGEIALEYSPQSIEVGVITLTDDELASDESSAQSSVGLLQASRDVFARTAAFELGAYWFRTRGYDNKNNEVLFNGVKMNKIDNGRVDYGNWGGLNDVTRYPSEVIYGLDPSDYTFGDLGGVTYIDTRPSVMRTGTSLSYSLTNRSYRQRVMATHNTGLNKNGWGFMASGSRRWAEEGRIDGTFYDAWAYYLGVEKKLNDKHSLNFTLMGAPYRRAGNSPNTQEIYDLMGTDYNAYWGYQNGEKRSERVKKNHEPMAQLTHHWDFDENSKLTTTVAYQTGKHGSSRLDWNNAPNPSPIYYRNFPSWYEETGFDTENIINAWKTDTNVSQINWASLYAANANAGEAVYFLVSDVNEDDVFSVTSNLRKQLNEKITFYAGLRYQNTQSNMYRELDDLLGAADLLDQDDFADPGQGGDADETNPNRRAKVGDKVQYNYNIDHNYMDAFASAEIKFDKLDVTVGGKVANTSIQREGLFDYYRYDNSLGKSKKHNFLDFGGKLQLLYKIDGRNFISANGAYYTKAPSVNDVFPQGRTNNFSIPDLESVKIQSADINYILRGSKIKGRATAFYTKTADEVETAFGYLQVDSQNSSNNLFTAEVLSGVDKQYIGTELSIEAQLTTTLSVQGVASIGQYTYANNPDLYYFSDEFGNDGFEYRGKAYLDNYKLASSPQKGYSVGFQYRDPHYWWFGMTANYLQENYVDISASRRTQQFLQDPGTPLYEITDPIVRDLLKQEKFSDEFMLNANAGKTFRFGDYYMGISLSVSNVLDNKNYRTGGFEQLRIANITTMQDEELSKVFGNRYWYDQGLSYFFNVFLRF